MAYKKLKYWFDSVLARNLADKICLVESEFDKVSFVESIDNQIDTLELKARVEVFADALNQFLPGNYGL